MTTENNNENASFWRDQFEKIGNAPVTWQMSARDLICSANTLYQQLLDVEILRQQEPDTPISLALFHTSVIPIMLLYGLAIENLIKGLIVAMGIPATSKGKLNKSFKTHNLKALFKLASISISQDDVNLLERLKRVVESGKYPVAKIPKIFNENDKDSYNYFILPRDIEHIGCLMEMLESELYAVQPENILIPIDLMTLCKRTKSKEHNFQIQHRKRSQ